MSPQQLLEKLQSGWLVLTPEGTSLALISPVHAEGVVAPLYTERAAAEGALSYYPELGEFTMYPAPSLWETARLLAAQGFAGILVDEQLPLFFVTTKPESELPTHVAIPQEAEYLILDQEGETPLGKADVTLWQHLDAFDKRSITWMLQERLPFLGYQEDMPFFEYLPEGAPQPVADKGALLEAEQTVQGSIVLFSDEYATEWYWDTLVGQGVAARAVRPVNDLVEWLESRHTPGLALILNPGRHRFYQGFFRKAGENWYLITINGVWLVESPFRCTQVARRQL